MCSRLAACHMAGALLLKWMYREKGEGTKLCSLSPGGDTAKPGSAGMRGLHRDCSLKLFPQVAGFNFSALDKSLISVDLRCSICKMGMFIAYLEETLSQSSRRD